MGFTGSLNLAYQKKFCFTDDAIQDPMNVLYMFLGPVKKMVVIKIVVSLNLSMDFKGFNF